MNTPENLVKAVERLKPQLVLLLDANTIMDYPQFVSHEIAAAGPFLLVIPQVVDNELLGLTFNNHPEKREAKQKASRARKQLGRLYERGNAKDGIDLGNDRWIIAASAPRLRPDGTRLEDDQIWRYLGQVDAALLRLADACTEDLPNTRTLLITRDRNLMYVARSRGLAVYSWPKLRLPEILDKLLLPDDRSGPVPDIDTHFSSLLDPNEERPVKIAMTLEELRSEGDYLVARGMGRLTYDDEECRFRWTFPFENGGSVGDLDELLKMLGSQSTMPIENLDFFGEEESIPEPVKQPVCSMLENAGWNDLDSTINATLFWQEILDGGIEWKHFWHRGLYSLLSPHIRVRLAFMYMEATLWGYSQSILSDEMKQILDEQSDLSQLCKEYIRCCEAVISHALPSLPSEHEVGDKFERALAKVIAKDVTKYGEAGLSILQRVSLEHDDDGGTEYKSIGDAYLKAFQTHEALSEQLGDPVSSLDSGLEWLLDVAADSWSVGETRDQEFTYSPFALPQGGNAAMAEDSEG